MSVSLVRRLAQLPREKTRQWDRRDRFVGLTADGSWPRLTWQPTGSGGGGQIDKIGATGQCYPWRKRSATSSIAITFSSGVP